MFRFCTILETVLKKFQTVILMDFMCANYIYKPVFKSDSLTFPRV
jgi:hypothetical protein